MIKQGQGMDVIARTLQARATLCAAEANSDGKSCLALTSQAGANASWHVDLSDAFWAQASWFLVVSSAAMALSTTQGKHRAAGIPAFSAATP